jgi:hypothetical protein
MKLKSTAIAALLLFAAAPGFADASPRRPAGLQVCLPGKTRCGKDGHVHKCDPLGAHWEHLSKKC